MYPIKRTPEQGHDPACWTKAINTALENERDALAKSDHYLGGTGRTSAHTFRLWLQENGPLEEAERLLSEGLTVCLCEPLS